MRLAFALTILGLAGCGTTQQYGVESPYYRYPLGSMLVLNRPLEIPPDSATVRLQFGRVVARNEVREIEPHCIFEVRTVSPQPQQVAPEEFEITQVRRSTSSIAAGFSPSSAYVGTGMGIGVGIGGDRGPTQIYYKTEFFLRSATQPNVYAMTCQSVQFLSASPAYQRHVTVPEIQQALGEFFTLLLPG
jgi:hypothetical protein